MYTHICIYIHMSTHTYTNMYNGIWKYKTVSFTIFTSSSIEVGWKRCLSHLGLRAIGRHFFSFYQNIPSSSLTSVSVHNLHQCQHQSLLSEIWFSDLNLVGVTAGQTLLLRRWLSTLTPHSYRNLHHHHHFMNLTSSTSSPSSLVSMKHNHHQHQHH